jgi:hypothetical protein
MPIHGRYQDEVGCQSVQEPAGSKHNTYAYLAIETCDCRDRAVFDQNLLRVPLAQATEPQKPPDGQISVKSPLQKDSDLPNTQISLIPAAVLFL